MSFQERQIVGIVLEVKSATQRDHHTAQCVCCLQVEAACVYTRPTLIRKWGDFLPMGFLSAGCSSCLKTLYLSPVSGWPKEGGIVIKSINNYSQSSKYSF